MIGNREYFKGICDRYINWFDAFIEKAKEAGARGLIVEKEEKMMNEEAETGMMDEQEIGNWIDGINKRIEGEMDEWTKERLIMEREVLNHVLNGKRGV